MPGKSSRCVRPSFCPISLMLFAFCLSDILPGTLVFYGILGCFYPFTYLHSALKTPREEWGDILSFTASITTCLQQLGLGQSYFGSRCLEQWFKLLAQMCVLGKLFLCRENSKYVSKWFRLFVSFGNEDWVLLWCKSSHSHHAHKRAWLCSNKTLLATQLCWPMGHNLPTPDSQNCRGTSFDIVEIGCYTREDKSLGV